MASTLIATSDLKNYVETGLTDDQLDAYVDAVDAEILKAVGPHDGERTEELYGSRDNPYRLWLRTPAETIASVSEYWLYDGPSQAVAVDADAYYLEHEGFALRRIPAKGYWRHRVRVTYTPMPTNVFRTQALIDLVQLHLRFSGVAEETAGDYEYISPDHEKERRRILKRLVDQVQR